MKTLKDIEIKDFNESNLIRFKNINIDEDTEVYNVTMHVFVKNNFLQCISESLTFHSKELLTFFDNCKDIYDKLTGNTTIESIENKKCILTLKAISKGYIEISGTIEQLIGSNKCEFTLLFDQTCLKDKFNIS